MIFESRADAGRRLSMQLYDMCNQQDVVGKPRGGVVVAYEIASATLGIVSGEPAETFPSGV